MTNSGDSSELKSSAYDKMLTKFSLAVGACVVFFLFLEGLCSILPVVHRLWSPPERRALSGPSMQYDQDLGWVSVRGFYERDYYAPGIYLRTNSQGFRDNQEFTQQVPRGKIRVICSGDSFTFGEGVSNDSTWCQTLEALNARFQSVNMGESGYGVDQMYLRYRRDGSVLERDVHVFAFILEDFQRMLHANYVGYGKPTLIVRNGELEAENVPVPTESRLFHWLGQTRAKLRELRSVELLGLLTGWLLPAQNSAFSNGPTLEQSVILDNMFQDLQVMEKQRHSVLVLACLPTKLHNYQQDGPAPAWRAWIRAESARRGIVFLDLVADFQKLPVTMKDGMFISPGSLHYFAEAPGHYDDEGNEWVAKEIHDRLLATPEVAAKLRSPPEDQVATFPQNEDAPGRVTEHRSSTYSAPTRSLATGLSQGTGDGG